LGVTSRSHKMLFSFVIAARPLLNLSLISGSIIIIIIIIIRLTARGCADVRVTDVAQNRDQWRTVENRGRQLPVP
jgi:hypothetical protein